MNFNALKALTKAPGNLKNKLALYAKVAPQVQQSIKTLNREDLNKWMATDQGYMKLARHIHNGIEPSIRDQFTVEQLHEVLLMNKGLLSKAVK